MLIIKAIILGIIQGLTEFIPVSSSAHLVMIPWLFSWHDPALTSLSFDVALHIGTFLSLIYYFASEWMILTKAGIMSVVEHKIGNDSDRRMAWFLVIGSFPAAIAGMLFENKVENIFHGDRIQTSTMIIMGAILAFLGMLLYMADKFVCHGRSIMQMSFRDSILIGFAQACALFPGVSRSGSTITAGLALGLKREAAARFSFMLSAPIIAGAGIINFMKILKAIKAGSFGYSDFVLFIIGIITATVSGILCIKFLLKFLQTRSTIIFSVYRWILAAFIITVALMR